MKKLILLLPLFLFLQSCETEEPKDIFGDNVPDCNAYEIAYNYDPLLSPLKDEYSFSKATTNISIAEYSETNELVNVVFWGNAKPFSTKTFIAHERATKIVIYLSIKYFSRSQPLLELEMYVANVITLDKKFTKYTFYKDTPTSNFNPIK